MKYHPAPIDTTSVDLPPALAALTERLAENTHDIWAAQRLRDGWIVGSKRDDARRQHPCLVPYQNLPEAEKAYDRLTAVGTLKAILSLGYQIIPPAA